MTATSEPTVLLVDDDDRFRSRLARALGDRGYEVRGAASAEQAIALSEQDSAELALVDLRLPGWSGLALIPELKRIDSATTIVVLTGYGSIATAIDALRLGAANYLTKPVDADEVLRAFGRGPELAAGPEQVPSLARVEWEHIHRVLTDCGGNISQAARLLGIHRRSLQRKLCKSPAPR